MGNRIQRAYGIGAPYINVFPVPVSAQRAPVSGVDVDYPQGQVWFDNSVSPVVEYVFDGHGNWVTGTPGSISSILGTTNQITAATAAGVTTLSIPSTFIAPGSIASTTTLTGGTGVTATTGNVTATAGAVNAGTSMTATLGNITATNGNFVASTSGTGILLTSAQASGVASGPVVVNGRSGRATFTSVSIAAAADLTLTITNSAITASTTEVLLSMSGATTGSALSIKSKTASSGSLAIVVTNGTGASTTTADIQFDFLVLNA